MNGVFGGFWFLAFEITPYACQSKKGTHCIRITSSRSSNMIALWLLVTSCTSMLLSVHTTHADLLMCGSGAVFNTLPQVAGHNDQVESTEMRCRDVKEQKGIGCASIEKILDLLKLLKQGCKTFFAL